MKKVMRQSTFLVFILLGLCISLTSCKLTDPSKITSNMIVRIKKDFCNEYLLPVNPNAHWEDVSFYKFLYRYPDKEKKSTNFYLIAWEVYEESEKWELKIEGKTLYFLHEVKFLVYWSNTRKFYGIEESLRLDFISLKDIIIGVTEFEIFIKVS